MSKLFLLLIPICGLLSCSNELEEIPSVAFATSDNDLVLSVDDQETLIERDIKNYIAHIKWGNSSWDNVYFNASDNSEWNTSYKFNTNRQFLK